MEDGDDDDDDDDDDGEDDDDDDGRWRQSVVQPILAMPRSL